MMHNTAPIQKRLVLLIAFSIIWIFIGSLVIFHQEHVMGKIHKWHNITFVVPKSKEKIAPVLQNQGNSDHPAVELASALVDNCGIEQYQSGSGTTLSQTWNKEIHSLILFQSLSLRAPPAA